MRTARKTLAIMIAFMAFFVFGLGIISPSRVQGSSSIYLSPGQGTFEVGSAFNVSFFVDTSDTDVNAVRLDVQFPPDKIQVAEPSVGNSFVSIWVEQPQYSNTTGTISLQGGLPSPGINTSAGLISTVTFRAKAPGTAIISVLGTSAVLANDGLGTNILSSRGNGVMSITIPAPEGPTVISQSHGDMNRWYRDPNVSFSWSITGVESSLEDLPVEYSWSFNKDASDIPDNTPEGSDTSIQYEDVENGVWYFHIKALMGGIWGSTTHVPVMIDAKEPAEFEPVVDPTVAPSDEKRVATFVTSDQHSGVDHYEVRVESLTDPSTTEFFFVEKVSPYSLPEFEDGEYVLTVRAFDRAGNWRDGTAEFDVRTNFLRVVRGNIFIGDYSWRSSDFAFGVAVFLILLLIVLLLGRKRYQRYRRRHPHILKEVKDRMRKEEPEEDTMRGMV